MIEIDTASHRPMHRQISDGVRMRIATGQLSVGAQVPSVRKLAKQLGINPNTVAMAYTELTREGWLQSRPGRGMFAASPRQLSEAERERRFSAAVIQFRNAVIGLEMGTEEVLRRLQTALEVKI